MIVAIQIGDSLGSGHRQSETLHVATTATPEQLETAYAHARIQWPHLCPDVYCTEYEEREVPAHIFDAMLKNGFVLREGAETRAVTKAGAFTPDAALLVEWICRFIRLGDSTCAIAPIQVPSLQAVLKGKGWGYGLY